jgi:hypothetical protein
MPGILTMPGIARLLPVQPPGCISQADRALGPQAEMLSGKRMQARTVLLDPT